MPNLNRKAFRCRLTFSCLLFLLALPHLSAQTFDLSTDRQPIASLDDLWRFHPGDDPRWAAPDFDDSTWKLLRSDKSWSEQGYPGMSGYGWYRFTIVLPANSPPSSLMLGGILTGFEVFVDGRRVGGLGSIAPAFSPFVAFNRTVLPVTNDVSETRRTLHVAIRVWHWPVWASYQGGGPHRTTLAGATELVNERLMFYQLARDAYLTETYMQAAIDIFIGVIVLGLFLLRRSEREYLWFAALLLIQAAGDFLSTLVGVFLSPCPILVRDLTDSAMQSAYYIALLYFISTALRARASRTQQICAALLIAVPFACFLFAAGLVSVPGVNLIGTACRSVSFVWILTFLTIRASRREPDARLLIAPAFLLLFYSLASSIANAASQFGAHWNTEFLDSYYDLKFFSLSLSTVIDLIFTLAMVAFLIRRFALTSKHEEHLENDLEAARQVQQVLLPDTNQPIPGFRIKAVYLPAESVGGDFYQVLPRPDASTLVVVGDVSGKGLKAAMAVSAVIGVLRSMPPSGPALTLQTLNRGIAGHLNGGFVTCCAAQIQADGSALIANAGHLSPYLNGAELPLDPGLPLGILPDITYGEEAFTLQPSDSLTFLSDGVVEAQTPSGELFGFTRTLAISSQPAQAIAQAAKDFGQQDDITVLTLEFLGDVRRGNPFAQPMLSGVLDQL